MPTLLRSRPELVPADDAGAADRPSRWGDVDPRIQARRDGIRSVHRRRRRRRLTAVAVVADTWWRAKTALDALPITWDEGPNAKASSATIAAMLAEGLDATEAFVGNQSGDAAAALKGASKVVEATYGVPFQNHATMEPMNATALWTTDKCEVWCPTQNGEAATIAA